MKKSMRHVLLLFVLIFTTGTICEIEAQNQTDYLNSGLEAKNAGEYESALEIWFEARQDLDVPNLKISVEYLRLVTEEKLRNYYPMAFAMYQWGLSAKDVEPNRDALTEEINRLTPIAESGRVEYWKQLLDSNDPHLYTELIYFWEELNILPINNYNSRLLEHWERISFAVDNYADEDREPFGTDIRGDYYVKFGPPSKRETLDLEIIRSDIASVLLTSTLPLEKTQFRQSTYYGVAHFWIYNALDETSGLDLNLIFREKPNGDIEQVTVIDDLIRSTSFLKKTWKFQDRKLSTGELIQLIYYKRLRNLSDEYASIYSSMESDLYSTISSRLFTSSGLNFKMLNRARAERDLNQAPENISTDIFAVKKIPLEIYQYRLLNDDYEPVFLTYVESKPLNAFYLDVINNDENLRSKRESFLDDVEKWRVNQLRYSENFNSELVAGKTLRDYQLRNTLDLKTEDSELITRTYIHPVLVIDEDDYSTPSVAAFEIPYIKSNTQQIFTSELRNSNKNSIPAIESSLPKNLRGLGKTSIPQPEHWDINENNLLVSDLIIGFQKHTELEEIDLFPFIVSNDRRIPSDEPLIIHFETYQLATDEQGMSQFEIDYDFTKTGSFLGLFNRTLEGISNTIIYDHDANRFAESLELQTTGMEPGEYRLSFTVTDKINGQSVNREVLFEVIKREEFYVSEL